MENQNNRKYITIFWSILTVAVIIGGYFLWQNHTTNQTGDVSQISTTTSQNATSTVSTNVDSGNPIVVTQPQPQKTNLTEPSLDRPLPDTSKLDPSTVSRAEAGIQVSVANLRKNQTSFQDWINLGLDRKTLGDYVGAAEDWEYVSALYPQNVISFGNLGDLYANYLHDNAKAEANYQLGIKSTPSNIDLYRNLYNLYITENKNAEAVVLLQKGVIANPNTFDLQLLLGRYYRDAGNATQAKAYYDQAISIAQRQGNTAAVQAFQTEEAQLH